MIDKTLLNNYNIIMDGIRFEWDENAILFDDPDHSTEEDRFILLGMSFAANMLIVCHCTREDDTVIRIISARKATRAESEQYTDMMKGW